MIKIYGKYYHPSDVLVSDILNEINCNPNLCIIIDGDNNCLLLAKDD